MAKKLTTMLFLIAGSLLYASPAFAQEAGPAGGVQWSVLTAGFGMAIASAIAALAQARAIAAACDGVARNPGASDSIRFFLILGLVLIESLALYTLLIMLKFTYLA